MSDETNNAAAALLHGTTKDILRELGSSGRTKTPGPLADNAATTLVGVVKRNDALLHALALDYCTRVADGLPPRVGKTAAPPKPAPNETEVQLDLTKAFDPPAPPKIDVDTEGGPKH